MLILFFTAALAGSSELWGTNGELWDPTGRLPDFSYAGYRAGDVPLPEPMVVASVRDFGAVGDGVADDTAALQQALIHTTGGVLLLPAGTYRVTGVLRVEHSGVVLRGEGPASVLQVEVSLADLFGAAPQWSWDGGLLWVEGPGTGSTLTEIVQPALRGDTTLTVADAAGIAVGDRVLLSITDDGSRSLTSHLHNDQDLGGTCAYQVPDSHLWPIRVVAVEGDVVTSSQPLRHDVRLAWSPELLAGPSVSEVGFEHFTIRFPDVPYAGHLAEPGYNGIYFSRGVADSWVDGVTFVNADNGVLLARWTQHVTAQGLVFEGRGGHHGFNLAHTADTLVQDVTFRAPFVHELSVDHKTNGCVFKEVRSDAPIALDHHRDAPFENLFTNFDTPTTWVHGGNLCAGPPSAARGTFWNLPGPLRGPYWGHIQTNVVGELDQEAVLTADSEWFEPVHDLWPPDLHEAQRRRRLGLAPELPPDTDDPVDSGASDPSDRGCATGGPPGAWMLLVAPWVRRRSRGARYPSEGRS